VVADDEELGDRIRELLGAQAAVTERRMFDGLAFLVHGNMAIAASGQGGVLVRVDPDQSDRLVRTSKATLAVMRGRPMPGWLRVAGEDVRTRWQLEKWVRLGTEFARSLPPKSETTGTRSRRSGAGRPPPSVRSSARRP
jgi:TfoX/Sxy family transcriptional regulator of competence genes